MVCLAICLIRQRIPEFYSCVFGAFGNVQLRLRKSTQNLRRGYKYRLDTYIYFMASHFWAAVRRFVTDAARKQSQAQIAEVLALLSGHLSLIR
jgi:hypothetical protein